MKFQDTYQNGEIRTKFYQEDADLQLALEELDHTLSHLGFLMTIKKVERKDTDYKLEMEISISD